MPPTVVEPHMHPPENATRPHQPPQVSRTVDQKTKTHSVVMNMSIQVVMPKHSRPKGPAEARSTAKERKQLQNE